MSNRLFKFEREMMDPVCEALPGALGIESAALSVLRTPAIGNVIPDFLFGEWQEGAVCFRGMMTHAEASVVAALRSSGEQSLSRLSEQIFVSQTSGQRYVSRLERLGAVRRASSGQYHLTLYALEDQCEIVAVEVKMSRWREALAQAVSYQDFADRAYVVLDASQVSFSEEVFTAFEAANVGLLVQGESSLQRIIRCVPRVRNTSARVIAAQKLKNAPTLCTMPGNIPSISEMQQAISSDAECQCV